MICPKCGAKTIWCDIPVYCLDCGYEKIRQNRLKSDSKPEFVRGEEVMVWDNDIRDTPSKAIYFGTAEGEEHPYIAKTIDDEYYVGYKYIRKLPQQEAGPKKFTKEDVQKYADKKGNGFNCGGMTIMLMISDFLKEHGMLEK